MIRLNQLRTTNLARSVEEGTKIDRATQR